MKLLKIFFLFLFCFSSTQKGFEISTPKKTVIPFQFINNLMKQEDGTTVTFKLILKDPIPYQDAN